MYTKEREPLNTNYKKRSIAVELLNNAGISAERFIPVEYADGHKKPTISGWQDLPQKEASEVDGPAGIVCGDGLVVIDVDYPEKLPENDLPEAPTVDTLHGNKHHLFAVEGEQPPSKSFDWGEIQSTDTMVVAPGAVFSHDNCRNDCSLTGENQYQFSNDVNLPTINPEDHPQIFNPDDEGRLPTQDISVPDGEYDETSVATMEAHIRDFYSDTSTTERARKYLQDLTMGKYSDRGFTTDEGDAARSEAEVAFASQLYGICLKYGDAAPEEHLHTVRNYITKSCDEALYTADGQPRKWAVRGENYKTSVLKTVFSRFDEDKWGRWQRMKNEEERRRGRMTNDYSDLTYEFTLEAVHQLVDEGEYPSKIDIIKKANEINAGDRSDETYRQALSRLQNEEGQIEMAYLGGNAYVYYPSNEPRPESAVWFKVGGEKIEC